MTEAKVAKQKPLAKTAVGRMLGALSREKAPAVFPIERNRRLYEKAMPEVSMLHRDGRFAIAAAELYQAILSDIAARDYDVFSGRAFVSRWGKLRRLPGIWRRAPQANA
jgi:phytoene synthase